MAEKGFGVKEINLIGASGTPSIDSPNNLNLNAVNVAISTNVSIGGTLTVTGNVSVGGTLTYEDVTNIDSVGIITARNGLNVSGGNVTIAKDIDVDGHTNLDNVNISGITTFANNVHAANVFTSYLSSTSGLVAPYADIDDYVDVGSNIKLGNAGVVTATSFSGSGANLTSLPAANLTGTLPALDGSALTGIAVTEAPVTDYTVTANGSSAYRFHGGGVDETADDPDLYLIRGQKYRFNNTTGSSHPFALRVSSGGSAYTDGVTGSQNGIQFFTVPYSAPASLVYQCTVHSGMVGNIYIRGGASVVTYESAKQLKLGNTTGAQVNSSNLVNINLGGTYHDTAGSTGKLKLYDDGNDEISFGVSNNSCDFILTSPSWAYNFYGGASGTTKLLTLNQTNNIQFLLGGSGSSSQTSPLTVDLGGTYSSSAGNGNNLSAKLKVWSDGTDLMGLSVSGNQLDYIVTSQNYDHVFYGGSAGTTELARFEGSGNLKFPNGNGIDFSATSNAGNSASMGSELFDDYEEGSWTPHLVSSAGNMSTTSFTLHQGYYTKIGRLVYIHGVMYGPRSSGGTGNLRISNLPYTVRNGDHAQLLTKDYQLSNYPTNFGHISGYGMQNATQINLFKREGSSQAGLPLSWWSTSANDYMYFNMTYTTDT